MIDSYLLKFLNIQKVKLTELISMWQTNR